MLRGNLKLICKSVSAQVHEKIETIIIKFDNPEAGMQMRSNNPRITNQYGENATPIRRVSLEYSNSTLSKDHTAKVKLIQFPIRLAWAITAQDSGANH